MKLLCCVLLGFCLLTLLIKAETFCIFVDEPSFEKEVLFAKFWNAIAVLLLLDLLTRDLVFQDWPVIENGPELFVKLDVK